MLTVGGSTTDQRFIDDAETWQSILQKQLLQFGHHETIASAGTIGHSTRAHLVSMRFWFPTIAGLNPRRYLFYVGLNDMLLAARGDQSHEVEQDFLTGAQDESWVAFLQTRSVFYGAWQTLLGMALARDHHVGDHHVDFNTHPYTKTRACPGIESRIAGDLAAYSSRLVELHALVKEKQAEMILVTQPSSYTRMHGGEKEGVLLPLTFKTARCNGLDFDVLLEAFNKETLRTCQALGATCFNLADELSFSQADFYDYVHNSPSGTHAIGEYLARKLTSDSN